VEEKGEMKVKQDTIIVAVHFRLHVPSITVSDYTLLEFEHEDQYTVQRVVGIARAIEIDDDFVALGYILLRVVL
jgi:hypothetical protein